MEKNGGKREQLVDYIQIPPFRKSRIWKEEREQPLIYFLGPSTWKAFLAFRDPLNFLK